ncbi:hypothetical protein [Amycolatopsis sp. La24]|uniref:hypothetical protein n=1 Tax=Amycolatopsis sp. La24 TaxID=3028304 RepID=UPI0023B0A31E|nr:hypothetical protein [Amycolatopsis sp. La24]
MAPPQTARALRTAMHRFLTGAVRHSGRQLTEQNCGRSRGVSRATVSQRSTADPEAAHREDKIRKLRLKLAAQKRACTDLQRHPGAAATEIAALHHGDMLLSEDLSDDTHQGRRPGDSDVSAQQTTSGF